MRLNHGPQNNQMQRTGRGASDGRPPLIWVLDGPTALDRAL